MNSESWRGKTFTVTDPDARVRKPGALHEFITKEGGVPVVITKGTRIRVDAVKVVPAGAKAVNIFVNVSAQDGATNFGWTSAGNLQGAFLSETIGTVPPPANASRFGPNAAWSNGNYLGQVTLVRVVGTRKEVEHIAEATCDHFLAMVEAARADGVGIGINSGFRSYPEQKHLHDGFTRKLPGFNPANRPGFSNHQNGIAFDIDVGGGTANPIYLWLAKHATRFGFLRTVKKEAWHWEYRPDDAAAAKGRGAHSTWG